MATPSLLHMIEENEKLDQLAEPVHRPVRVLLGGSPTMRTALEGTWVGHPLHAALTDIPVGAWTAGFVLDLVEVKGVSIRLRKAADAAHAVGLVGAGLAAVAGIADWSALKDKPRRVGFVHGMLNMAIAGLFGASLLMRARGHRGVGVTLSTLGFGTLLVSTWLGRQLSYRYGVGVNHSAFEGPGPVYWTDVGSAGELAEEGSRQRVEVEGRPVLLARKDGHLWAIGDTCTHMGCSLSQGELLGDRVVCRCGSQFALRDGEVLVGPATTSEPQFEARERYGRIEVRKGQLNGVVATSNPLPHLPPVSS